MRLVTVGDPTTRLAAAARIAMARGAAVAHAAGAEQVLRLVRAEGADLIMVDAAVPLRQLTERLDAAHIGTPLCVCGTGPDTAPCGPAGARDHFPLPSDPDRIAALLHALAGDARPPQPTAAATRSLVGRTVADVERDLILDTLDHCRGNRTHAARILGISIRTLRNKLSEYTGAGIPVAAPGEARASAA